MTVTLSHLPMPAGLTVTLSRDTHRARFTRNGCTFADETVDESHLKPGMLIRWCETMMRMGYAVAQEIAWPSA